MELTREIDLIELTIKIVGLLKRRFYIFLLFFLIGIGLVIFHFCSSKTYYTTTSVVNSEIMSNYRAAEILNTIQLYFSENRYKELSCGVIFNPKSNTIASFNGFISIL